MPTYEYECKSCSHCFEVFQTMSDLPIKDCPECGKEVRRLIFGGAGVIFKGSGF
ncbi:MAG: zinc ribbon domain-containing protein, partial [Treponema sp.]|nr:zinc ribbon domain-containing protein [Treponema sp.]